MTLMTRTPSAPAKSCESDRVLFRAPEAQLRHKELLHIALNHAASRSGETVKPNRAGGAGRLILGTFFWVCLYFFF